MKIFIIGLPESGHNQVANSLSDDSNMYYISASDWLRSTFRTPRSLEKADDYDQEYFEYFISRLKLNPNIFIDNANQIISLISAVSPKTNFVINGIINPGDFTSLFNYNTDVVVFLNRTDSGYNPKDHEGVSVNVIRDYCLYLAALGLLSRDRWLEYNYKIPGEEVDFVKQLGKHNTVTITKSLNKAIEHLKGELCKLLSTKD